MLVGAASDLWCVFAELIMRYSLMSSLVCITIKTGWEWSIAISLSVCMSVCPRAFLWNRWTDRYEFCIQISCGRGSVLLWRRCDTLCASGFMDDVTFGRTGPGRLINYH